MSMSEDQVNNEHKKPLAKRMIIVIILLAIVFGAIFGWGLLRSYFMKRYFANFTPPPAAVSTATAISADWQPHIAAVGSMVAINGVSVSPELPGTVVKINFESGQIVKAGQSLVQLDDREDQQDLKNYEAQLTLMQINYRRQSALFKTQSAAASDLDTARANLQEAEANVAKTLVIIDKKNIKAPFDGKVGIRQVNLGQYVASGAALVSLQSMDPLYTQFYLPEQYLPSLYVGQPVALTIQGQDKRVFSGKITAINSQVSADSRNILVQATVPNPQYLLYPGMFANVQVILPQQKNVITVPQTAVDYNLYGDSIFVVQDGGKDKQGKPILKAVLKYVTVGERRGDQAAITSGINVGDVVVTSGQLKLQDGMTVVINNSGVMQSGKFNNQS